MDHEFLDTMACTYVGCQLRIDLHSHIQFQNQYHILSALAVVPVRIACCISIELLLPFQSTLVTTCQDSIFNPGNALPINYNRGDPSSR